jgi:hypothetical protein
MKYEPVNWQITKIGSNCISSIKVMYFIYIVFLNNRNMLCCALLVIHSATFVNQELKKFNQYTSNSF